MSAYHQEDYMMRMLHRFFEALDSIINGKETSLKTKEVQLNKLSEQFFSRDLGFFITRDLEEIKSELFSMGNGTKRLELLAILLFTASAIAIKEADKISLKAKAKELLLDYQHATKSISLEHLKILS